MCATASAGRSQKGLISKKLASRRAAPRGAGPRFRASSCFPSDVRLNAEGRQACYADWNKSAMGFRWMGPGVSAGYPSGVMATATSSPANPKASCSAS